MPYQEKVLNTRECIEETILHFNPTISDEDLLKLREEIYLKVWANTKNDYSISPGYTYHRDYYLYTRKRVIN